MYETIVVPTDGSSPSSAAAESAIALAERFGATIHAIHVLDLGDYSADVDDEVRIAAEDAAEGLVDEVAEMAADAGVTATTAVVDSAEPVHRAIVDSVREHDADCVVMGTQGRTGLQRLALGSVAARTLRVAPVPVVTVRDDGALDPTFERILVPTDGSDAASAAADHAIGLAAATDATLHVVHVVDTVSYSFEGVNPSVLDSLRAAGQTAMDDIVERAEKRGVRSTETSMQSGRTARAITEYAADQEVDCIVLGTHGRTGFDRLLLGSVTEEVVRLSDVPVFGIKPQEAIENLDAETNGGN